jgi:predicted nuclease of restriction endonuclease-like (RecB) superfamily
MSKLRISGPRKRTAKGNAVILGPDYDQFLSSLKTRIQTARLSAARAVNRDLVLLYWDIGRAIVEKQKSLNWGNSVVEMVAKDLRKEFPAMVGFSQANVWRMRQLHVVYSNEAILAQAVRELKNPAPSYRQENKD